jgi:hypothetical protein|eukprot:3955886-Prymnesium_polylepis.1
MPTSSSKYLQPHQRRLKGGISGALAKTLSAEPPDPLVYFGIRIIIDAAPLEPTNEARGVARRLSISCGDALPQEETSDKWSVASWLAGAGVYRVVAGAILKDLVGAGGGSATADDALAFLCARPQRPRGASQGAEHSLAVERCHRRRVERGGTVNFKISRV